MTTQPKDEKPQAGKPNPTPLLPISKVEVGKQPKQQAAKEQKSLPSEQACLDLLQSLAAFSALEGPLNWPSPKPFGQPVPVLAPVAVREIVEMLGRRVKETRSLLEGFSGRQL